MKRQCAIRALLVAVLLSAWDVRFVNGQGSSYLGLWGHVFDDSGSKKSADGTPTGPFPSPPGVASLADRLHQAAGEWRAEADEVRSRLIQRIGGGNIAEKGEEKESAASSFLSETFSQLFSANKENSPTETSKASEASDTGIATTETLGLLKRVQERLGLDGKIDAKQLAALAAIQGLALSSLRKHLANSQTAQATAVKSPTGEQQINDGGIIPSLYDPHLAFSKIGVALPDAMINHFEGEWCLRLQNFANAQGYRSVYLGGVPCSSSNINTAASTTISTPLIPQAQPSLATAAAAVSTPATAVLHWNPEAAFSLDCDYKTPSIASSVDTNEELKKEEEPERFYSGVSAMLHAAATKASSDFTAALQDKIMECSLAVSVSGGDATLSQSSQPSSQGSGTVLRHSQTIPVFNPHKLNAIKLRICNLPVTSPPTGGDTSALSSSREGASINVHGLKVNNRHLAVDSLYGQSSSECQVALLRLPTRALADGFVLNGYLTLEKGSTSGSTGVFNVGEMASVEMQIGSLRLLSTGSSGIEGGATEEHDEVSAPPLS